MTDKRRGYNPVLQGYDVVSRVSSAGDTPSSDDEQEPAAAAQQQQRQAAAPPRRRTPAELKQRAVLRNFAHMSLCFSLNHACVTAALALSTANLGVTLGNVSNAMLYIGYTASAVLLAAPVVRARGAKASLVASTAAFCVYVGSFCVAEVWKGGAWLAAVGGSMVGGVAAGVLFTAQGAYFTLAAREYARASDLRATTAEPPPAAIEQATALFAGVFAAIYLLSEVVFKLIAGLLPTVWDAGWIVVSFVYFCVAVASAAGMTQIWNLASEEEQDGGEGQEAVTMPVSRQPEPQQLSSASSGRLSQSDASASGSSDDYDDDDGALLQSTPLPVNH